MGDRLHGHWPRGGVVQTRKPKVERRLPKGKALLGQAIGYPLEDDRDAPLATRSPAPGHAISRDRRGKLRRAGVGNRNDHAVLPASLSQHICKESGGFQCTESDDCPAPAFGLDVGECELPLEGEGMPLDVGCDDPLPEDEYFGFSCCCRSRVTKY